MKITITKDSTRRALRTAYHVVVALAIGVPTYVPLFDKVAGKLPGGERLVAFGAVLMAAAAGASKTINYLEDRGAIPAFLKGDTPAPAPSDPAVADPAPDSPSVEPA